jgi:hypothetical protein
MSTSDHTTPQVQAAPDKTQPNGKKHYLLQFFKYEHLTLQQRAIAEPFSELAHKLVEMLPDNPERTVALRKLLESRDCAVRAELFKP